MAAIIYKLPASPWIWIIQEALEVQQAIKKKKGIRVYITLDWIKPYYDA